MSDSALNLSSKASELYHAMISSQPMGYLFKQTELQELIKAKDLNVLMKFAQELMNNVCIFYNYFVLLKVNIANMINVFSKWLNYHKMETIYYFQRYL